MMVSRMQLAHSVDGQSMQQHVLNVERLPFPRVASMPSGSLLTILKLISKVGAGFQQGDFALLLHIQYMCQWLQQGPGFHQCTNAWSDTLMMYSSLDVDALDKRVMSITQGIKCKI